MQTIIFLCISMLGIFLNLSPVKYLNGIGCEWDLLHGMSSKYPHTIDWDRLSVRFGWVGESLGHFDLWYRRRVHNSNLIRSCLLFCIVIFYMVKRGQLLNHIDLIESTLELSSHLSYHVPGSPKPPKTNREPVPGYSHYTWEKHLHALWWGECYWFF